MTTEDTKQFVHELMIVFDNMGVLLAAADEKEADKYVEEKKPALKAIWDKIIAGNPSNKDKILDSLLGYLSRTHKNIAVKTTGDNKNNYAQALRTILKSCSYLRAASANPGTSRVSKRMDEDNDNNDVTKSSRKKLNMSLGDDDANDNDEDMSITLTRNQNQMPKKTYQKNRNK